jgi:RNA polymerase sigma-70 factor, ECF subfamily
MQQTATSTLNRTSHANYAAYGNFDAALFDSRLDPETPTLNDGAAVAVSINEMITHRDYLVRFAARKLHDPALAEDVVHDVFEAVMAGNAVFNSRAALRSWLTAILKNKIIDVIRQRARFDSFDVDVDGEESEANAVASPSPGPHEIAEQRELLGQMLQRIASLPAGLRDVMQFRVLQDEASDVVCERLAISEASLFVRLHRARKQLLC